MLNEVSGPPAPPQRQNPSQVPSRIPSRLPRQPILVVAAALLDDQGRVLVQRRPPGRQHAGLWEFPGGKVEFGEEPRTALARELLEELAVVVAPEDAVPLAFADAPPVLLLLYVLQTWRGRPRAMEATGIRWMPPTALGDLAMPPLDRPLAEALARWVEARAGIEPACKDLQSSA